MSQAMPGRKTGAKSKSNGRSYSVSDLRERMGLTQQEFATLLGLSTVSISRWEHRHTRPTDASHALIGLLDRALAKKGDDGIPKIVTALRTISGTDELDRIIALVHLGDD